MSYTPTQWSTGDTITAEKLNKLENGIANSGGSLIVNITQDDGLVMDKTFGDIWDAFTGGSTIRFQYIDGGVGYSLVYLSGIVSDSPDYIIRLYYIESTTAETIVFAANTPNDYPTSHLSS